jgi:hypothetical protein
MFARIPLLLMLLPFGTAFAQQPTVTVKAAKPEYRDQAKITPEQATQTALAKVPGGQVREAELEQEHGRLVYSFDIEVPKQKGVEEVQVDARSGKVVSKVHESPDAEASEAAHEHEDAQHEHGDSSHH